MNIKHIRRSNPALISLQSSLGDPAHYARHRQAFGKLSADSVKVQGELAKAGHDGAQRMNASTVRMP